MQIHDLFAFTVCVFQTIKIISLSKYMHIIEKKTNRPPTAIHMYMSNDLDLE